jgi:transposase-like protein
MSTLSLLERKIMEANQTPTSTSTQNVVITPQLKQAIVVLLLENKKVSTLAKQYGLSVNTLYSWRKEAQRERDAALPKNKLSNEEWQKAYTKLEKEKFEADQENLILKKALVILGKSTN